MSRMISGMLLVLALLGVAWRVSQRHVESLSSRIVLEAAPVRAGPVPGGGALCLPETAPSVHAATLAQLADGRLACAWFAGAREGARDVAIYLSTLYDGTWSPPWKIADRAQTASDTQRYVRKLGNPVLGADDAGRLHLWYVSTSMGGWCTAALNYRVSEDGGRSWSRARRLVATPLFNLGTLVRTAPLRLADGGFALPAYHECLTKHAEMFRLKSDGTVVGKTDIPGDRAMLQPAVVALPDRRELLALMRDSGDVPHRIGAARFDDAHGRWTEDASLPIPNPDSSVALIRLRDGRLLLACNPLEKGRHRLSLWLSGDDGLTWAEAEVVEYNPGSDDEYSYPSLLQDAGGRIHLVYTWKRQQIRYRSFEPNALAMHDVKGVTP